MKRWRLLIFPIISKILLVVIGVSSPEYYYNLGSHQFNKVLYDESKKVSDWYENLAAKSDLTADYYLRNFGLWLEGTRKTKNR